MIPIYFKSEKTGSQIYRASRSTKKNTVPAIFWRVEKTGSLAIWRPNNEVEKTQFTNTVRRKEKHYDIYLRVRETGSQPVGARKKCFPAIWIVDQTGS